MVRFEKIQNFDDEFTALYVNDSENGSYATMQQHDDAVHCPEFRAAMLAVRRAAKQVRVNLSIHDLEDLASQSLLRLLASQQGERPLSNLKPIWTIAHNLLIDFLRSNRRAPLALADLSRFPIADQERHEILDILTENAPPLQRKIVDAVRDGVEPTKEALAAVLRTHPDNIRKYIHVFRSLFTRKAIESIDKTIHEEIARGKVNRDPSIFDHARNRTHLDEMRVLAQRRSLRLADHFSKCNPKDERSQIALAYCTLQAFRQATDVRTADDPLLACHMRINFVLSISRENAFRGEPVPNELLIIYAEACLIAMSLNSRQALSALESVDFPIPVDIDVEWATRCAYENFFAESVVQTT